jgi:hypothetical protein
LISEFKTELGKDKKLSKAINYNTKSTTMPKNKGKKFDGKIPDYENRKAELEYLKSSGKEDEYKEKKADLDNRVAASIYLRQQGQEDKFKSSIASAEKNKDWKAASALVAQQKDFDDNKIDFSATKDKHKMSSNITTDDKGKIHGFGSRVVSGGKELDLDYDSIYKSFESDYKAPVEKQEETFQPVKDPNLSATNVGGGSSRKEEYVPVGVDDRAKSSGSGKFNQEIDGEERDWEGEWEKSKQDLAEYQDYQQQNFEHNYAPDSQSDGDLFGTLMDAGRGVMGAIGAGKEIPEYSRGSMFSEAMGDAQKFKNEGLSGTEIDYRRNLAETGYAYDVKNIRRLAGGSAGVALGNLGRAQTQLQDKYTDIAAADEGVRRDNRKNFQGMAMKDEMVNRQIFQDELRQTEMTKQAGAGLVQDAIRNIQDRSDFNKQYGKDSAHYQYMKSKDRDIQESIFNRENANERRSREGQRELEYNETQARQNYEKNNTLDGDTNTIIPKEVKKENPLSILDQYSPEEINTSVDSKGNMLQKASSSLDTKTDVQKQRAKTNESITSKVSSKAPRKRYDVLLEAREFGGLADNDEAEFQKLKKDHKF